jgi:primary-amine oxidase
MKLLSALLFGLLSQDVLARTSKSHKGGKSRGKRLIHDALRRGSEAHVTRDDANKTVACAEALASPITAPKPNIWGQLTDDEAASVVAWLFAQKDLNLTVSENATSWDNSV